jgi:RNA polymerase sigma factor (sigma-70 family)
MSTLEFNHLVRVNSPSLHSFAYNFTKNVEDAEDLLQDTVLKALRYKENFQDGTNFKGWLFTIMRNIFLNNCKKQQLGRSIFHGAELNDSMQLSAQADNNILRSIHHKDIQEAVSGLKDELRVPFQMAFEGYQYDEIASKMGVPTGTIKSRIFNARKSLMASLKDFN